MTFDLTYLEETIRQAGTLILQVYETTNFDVDIKQDESPVTIADKKANDLLVSQIQEKYPDIPFVTEETKNAAFDVRKDWEYSWIIDPLDGTKEFINRNGDFTVNIALCKNHKIIFGMILVPITGDLYYAELGKGAFKKSQGEILQIHAVKPEKDLIVVASRSHRSQKVDDFVEQLTPHFEHVRFISRGSSLKICMVAEGKAHIYPRLGPTMEWDTAAGQIIAEESGATMLQEDGDAMIYNKEDLLNPYFIVSSFDYSEVSKP